ncbi:hypothetical protein [Xenorhabdus bovienii]
MNIDTVAFVPVAIYAYTPPLISVVGLDVSGAAVHLIDEMRINPQ